MDIFVAIIGVIVSIIGTGYFVHTRDLGKKKKNKIYHIDKEIDNICSELY